MKKSIASVDLPSDTIYEYGIEEESILYAAEDEAPEYITNPQNNICL